MIVHNVALRSHIVDSCCFRQGLRLFTKPARRSCLAAGPWRVACFNFALFWARNSSVVYSLSSALAATAMVI